MHGCNSVYPPYVDERQTPPFHSLPHCWIDVSSSTEPVSHRRTQLLKSNLSESKCGQINTRVWLSLSQHTSSTSNTEGKRRMLHFLNELLRTHLGDIENDIKNSGKEFAKVDKPPQHTQCEQGEVLALYLNPFTK